MVVFFSLLWNRKPFSTVDYGGILRTYCVKNVLIKWNLFVMILSQGWIIDGICHEIVGGFYFGWWLLVVLVIADQYKKYSVLGFRRQWNEEAKLFERSFRCELTYMWIPYFGYMWFYFMILSDVWILRLISVTLYFLIYGHFLCDNFDRVAWTNFDLLLHL